MGHTALEEGGEAGDAGDALLVEPLHQLRHTHAVGQKAGVTALPPPPPPLQAPRSGCNDRRPTAMRVREGSEPAGGRWGGGGGGDLRLVLGEAADDDALVRLELHICRHHRVGHDLVQALSRERGGHTPIPSGATRATPPPSWARATHPSRGLGRVTHGNREGGRGEGGGCSPLPLRPPPLRAHRPGLGGDGLWTGGPIRRGNHLCAAGTVIRPPALAQSRPHRHRCPGSHGGPTPQGRRSGG